MFRKFIFVFLVVVLLAGMVGLGIHLLHKDARAQIIYKCYIWFSDEGIPTPVTDAWMEARFDGGDWTLPDDELEGWYKWIQEECDEWDLVIGNGNWIGVDPVEGRWWFDIGGTVHWVEWEVE